MMLVRVASQRVALRMECCAVWVECICIDAAQRRPVEEAGRRAMQRCACGLGAEAGRSARGALVEPSRGRSQRQQPANRVLSFCSQSHGGHHTMGLAGAAQRGIGERSAATAAGLSLSSNRRERTPPRQLPRGRSRPPAAGAVDVDPLSRTLSIYLRVPIGPAHSHSLFCSLFGRRLHIVSFCVFFFFSRAETHRKQHHGCQAEQARERGRQGQEVGRQGERLCIGRHVDPKAPCRGREKTVF